MASWTGLSFYFCNKQVVVRCCIRPRECIRNLFIGRRVIHCLLLTRSSKWNSTSSSSTCSGAVVAVAIIVGVSVTNWKSTGWGVGPSSFTRAPYPWGTAPAVLGLGFARSEKIEHGKMLYPFTDGIWLPAFSLASRLMPLPRVWLSSCPGWLLASWGVCVDHYRSAIHQMPGRCDHLTTTYSAPCTPDSMVQTVNVQCWCFAKFEFHQKDFP